MLSPQLPPELIASIFEILAAHNDWDAIRACCLLSSHYSPLARQHLFSTVKLKFGSHSNHLSIRDVVRRVQGLRQLLQTKPDINRFIKNLEILDSYPVYDSQWITQQPCLPHFLSLLENVQSCTFGCEVGYLVWSSFSPELQAALRKLFMSPHLQTMSLRNLVSVPEVLLRNPVVRYLYLNHVSTPEPSHDLLQNDTPFQRDDSRRLTAASSEDPPNIQLVYLNIRTIERINTETISRLIKTHGKNLRIIKWRCWEDAQSRFGSSLSGAIDIGTLPSLRKLSFRLSFGNIGRDLVGLCDLLDSTSQPMDNLQSLEISILFPNQSSPHRVLDIRSHMFWSQLAIVLAKPEYHHLQYLSVNLTIRQKRQSRQGHHREDAVTEFRKQIGHALRRLSNMPTLQFRCKVHTFNPDH